MTGKVTVKENTMVHTARIIHTTDPTQTNLAAHAPMPSAGASKSLET